MSAQTNAPEVIYQNSQVAVIDLKKSSIKEPFFIIIALLSTFQFLFL